MASIFSVEGRLVDVHRQRIYPARITVEGNRISEIIELKEDELRTQHFIMPGFTDAHIHIESSMLVPSEFARLAVVHGTVATVSDPHEIANVCGVKGVEYMIANGETVPFKFNFGAPSCVPATTFETAGAEITVDEIDQLLQRKDVLYLSEMMNFPGVLARDQAVMSKIESAKKHKKPVDGHAPGLRGVEARTYIDAGISTDHECFTEEEAKEKIGYGMKILIREGSAAKNFDALIPLLKEFPNQVMFCSDDKHPDSLVEGHINELCERSIRAGVDIFSTLKAACVNPVLHYQLKVGLLRLNDFADFICVENLEQFKVLRTYINGELVAENGVTLIPLSKISTTPLNNFHISSISSSDLLADKSSYNKFPAIEALDGQLITNKLKIPEGCTLPDVSLDLLKIVVVNRYQKSKVAMGWIKNFRLGRGAIASSVAHDSHNIVAVGVDDESICHAVNAVIEARGGVSCVDADRAVMLPLPVAGLMSEEDGYAVAKHYSAIDKAAKDLGSTLSSPFMTLSFMALLVIPHLKLSDKGLFDGADFKILV